MITVICTFDPGELPEVITGIDSQYKREPGEQVQIEMANGTREVLGFGHVSACRPYPEKEWPGRWRYDVEVE